MAKIVVIYFSGYGHTKRVAEHVAQGANADLVAVDSNGDIQEADWQKLNDAKGIIFGAPTYMGNVPWQFKKFADASSKVWFTRGWQDKVFGGFTNSASLNGDKQVSLAVDANPGLSARRHLGEPGPAAFEYPGGNPRRREQPGRLGRAAGAVSV